MGKPCEVLALQYAGAQVGEFLAHRRIVGQFVGLHQNVPHVHLIDHDLLIAAAHLIQSHDVKPRGRAQRLGDFARLQPHHDVRQEGRQLGAFAPVKSASVQGVLAV